MMAASEKYYSSLDLNKINRNKFCGKWSVKGKADGAYGKVWRYARLGCKKWNCPRCGPRRAKRLRYEISKKANELQLTRFLTLTLDHKDVTAEDSLKYLRDCWNKFRVYLKRKYGQSITFISIVEPQKSGHAHLHILVDRYIDQRWISDNWHAVGGGKMVFIKRVDIHRVSKYLSKYLTKEILSSGYFSKYRRYTTSRNIVLFAKPKEKWHLFMIPLELILERKIKDIVEMKFDEIGILDWFNVDEPV
jgi:hypothetical protein